MGINGNWKDESYSITHNGSIEDSDLMILALDKNGNSIAEAQIERFDGFIVSGTTRVHEDHRRKGIASGMYQYAEKLTNLPIRPVTSIPDKDKDGSFGYMSDAGKKLWNQKNKIFGEKQWTIEGYTFLVLSLDKESDQKSILPYLSHFNESGITFKNIKDGSEIYSFEDLSDTIEKLKNGLYQFDYEGYGLIAIALTSTGSVAGFVTTECGGIVLLSKVYDDHQRKGLASEMYKLVGAEPSHSSQTNDAKALWNSIKRS